MPMLDLQNQRAALARAGKIRLGIKTKNAQGVEYPKETEYFVLKDVPELAEHFKGTTGSDKPTELPIFFPFDEIDECIVGWHKLYTASSLWCKGDGDTINYSVDTATGKVNIRNGIVIRPLTLETENGQKSEFAVGDTVRCPGYNGADRWGKCKFCAPQSTLIFMVRGLPVDDLRLATYHIETRSVNNYARLRSQLLAARSIAERMTGRAYLAGIPFILRRIKEKIGAPNLDRNGGRKKKNGKLLPVKMRVEKYLLELEIEPGWIQSMMSRFGQLADPDQVALVPDRIEDDDVIEAEPIGDSFINEDFGRFARRLVADVPFFETPGDIEAVLAEMDLLYDPENEPFLYDALASFANTKADEKADGEELSS